MSRFVSVIFFWLLSVSTSFVCLTLNFLGTGCLGLIFPGTAVLSIIYQILLVLVSFADDNLYWMISASYFGQAGPLDSYQFNDVANLTPEVLAELGKN